MKNVKKLEKSIIGSLHSFSEEEVSIIQEKLLSWYHKNKRVLPWRTIAETEKDINKRIYAVWISEIMLQQTQVATVISYFERWISKWPTPEALSKATLEEVNEVWAGLGYYSRARRLHEGAQKVMEELKGELPRTRDKLISELSGVGQYTGSAIASIALKEKVGVVDGNVIRVFTRLRGIGKDSQAQVTIDHLWSLANGIVDHSTPGDFNQGLMELGATVCTPKNPLCSSCPLSDVCVAYAKSRSVKTSVNHFIKLESSTTKKEEPNFIRDLECLSDCDFCLSKEDYDGSLGVQNYPRKGKKTKSRDAISAVVIIRQSNGEMLLLQRPAKGLLANLYEFVSIDITEEEDHESYVTCKLVEDYGLPHKTAKSRKYITEVLHIFSHIRQTYRVFLMELGKDVEVKWPDHYQSHAWLSKDAYLISATSTAMKKVFKATDSSFTKNKSTEHSEIMPASSKRRLEDPVEPRLKKARKDRRIVQLFRQDDVTNAKHLETSQNLRTKPLDQDCDTNNNLQSSKISDDAPSTNNAVNTNGLDLQQHRCPTCARGFPFKSHVKRHMVVHKVRRRPTQCPVCEIKFMQQEEGGRRSHRISKELGLRECCHRTLRKYVFQRSLMKNQSIKGHKG